MFLCFSSCFCLSRHLSLHFFLTVLLHIIPIFRFSISRPFLPPRLPLMPLLSSVAVLKTGRCAAITLIGCDFFIYMTSAQQSWEPTACFLHPSPALVSLGLRSPGFGGGGGTTMRSNGGRQRGGWWGVSGITWFMILLMGLESLKDPDSQEWIY